MGTEETALELIWLAYSAVLRDADHDAGSAGLFQEAATQRHGVLSALDRLPFGVILPDDADNPVHLKRAAARLAKLRCLNAASPDSLS